jgi:transposase
MPKPTSNTEPTYAELQAQNGELADMIRKLQGTIEKQQATINDLLRRLYGRKSERLDPNQTLMDDVLIETLGEGATEEPEIASELPWLSKPKGKAKRNGRLELPEHLPHEEIIIPATEEQKTCPESGEPRRLIGYEESKKLDYVPETLKVLVIKREKWGSPMGSEEAGVITAEKPSEAVPRCLAANGLLAHVAVSKFEDHQPLYRQERIFGRQNVPVSRKTMSDWLKGLSDALEPLETELCRRILAGNLVHHDDTPVNMLDPGAGKTKETRLWAALGGDRCQYVHFSFTRTRNKDGPEQFFRGYQGYIMCDEYGGYRSILNREGVTGLSCWAHARRRYDKAKLSKPAEAVEMLVMISELYKIEEQYRHAPEDVLLTVRRERSVSQLERIHEWVLEHQEQWLPKSPMAQAGQYVLNHWKGLKRYAESGDLPIDNNPVEQLIRQVAIGRKNWLFLGSETGGETAARLMSLIGTCHHLKINAWAYLKDVLDRLPDHPAERIGELLPDEWAAAGAADAEKQFTA